MRAPLVSMMLAGALAVTACKGSATQEQATEPDPTAGRNGVTVIYSGNAWAELLDCG